MTNSTTRRSVLKGAAALAAGTALPGIALAQEDYPSKQITYLIPYSPGGMSDNISRIVGERLTKLSGQNVVNDYKPGAGGTIAANYYSGVEPDGYTILQSTNSFFSLIPQVHNVTYDSKTDFTPMVLVGDAPMVMAVHPSTGFATLAEVVDYAKANPGALAFGTAGVGTVGHLCGVWLQRVTGIELLHIPYNGGGEALQACLSQESQIFFGPEAAEPILAGQLTGITTLGAQRWDRLPDVPSSVEAGIEGWAPRSWHTVTILSATPEDRQVRMTDMLNEILAEPEMVDRIKTLGLIPGIETREQMRQRANDDYEQFGELLRAAGII